MRVECYVIARKKKDGALSWIIVDYETNTTSHDPKKGFCGYSCDPGFFATTPYGELLVEARNEKNGNDFSIRADLRAGDTKALSKELWVDGNFSVDYGGRLLDPDSEPFGLIFDPYLMKEARALPLDAVEISRNNFLPGLIDGGKPIRAALFPFSQHFVIRQDLHGEGLADEAGLFRQLKIFMEGRFKTMAGTDITKPIFVGMMVSALVNLGIIGLLVWLLLS
jgi:hypothetical protein